MQEQAKLLHSAQEQVKQLQAELGLQAKSHKMAHEALAIEERCSRAQLQEQVRRPPCACTDVWVHASGWVGGSVLVSVCVCVCGRMGVGGWRGGSVWRGITAAPASDAMAVVFDRLHCCWEHMFLGMRLGGCNASVICFLAAFTHCLRLWVPARSLRSQKQFCGCHMLLGDRLRCVRGCKLLLLKCQDDTSA